MTTAVAVVVCGVCASGKSSIASALASALQCAFVDADPFHSAANKAKMAAGVPLTDDDRRDWLLALRDELSTRCHSSEPRGRPVVVLACSALKRNYRTTLCAEGVDVVFVQLLVSEECVNERIVRRSSHFLSTTALVKSQFATLEPLEADERGFVVSGEDASIEDVVAAICAKLSQGSAASQSPEEAQRVSVL
jgi:carbohydrate kinase (thermoresistant glucokinase family)